MLNEGTIKQAADWVICLLIFRTLVSWLAINKRLIRPAIVLVAVGSVYFLLRWAGLGASHILAEILIIPLVVLIILANLPELRRVAASVWSTQWFGSNKNEDSLMQELAEAVLQLSQKKTGAIIVLGKSSDPTTICTGGEAYDGGVTSSVLLSIFNPSSPQHDGAVIIRDGRICRIGAVLPLGEPNGKITGTRHLAGRGLSSQCDALVLVVSEETGNVTLFKDGDAVLLKENNVVALTSVLTKELPVGSSKAAHPAVPWAAAAVITATFLWLLAATSPRPGPVSFQPETSVYVLPVSVAYTNLPKHLYLSSGYSPTLIAQVRGPAGLVWDKLVWEIDLSGRTAGKHVLVPEVGAIKGIKPGCIVEIIHPESLKISLGELKSHVLRLQQGSKDVGWAKVLVPPSWGVPKYLEFDGTKVVLPIGYRLEDFGINR
jgi:diadenylate cyclase